MERKRLTFEGNFCNIAQCSSVPGGSFCEDGACSQRQVWERLKEYEDTEEDGRLIMLPVKTVFIPTWDAGPDCDLNCDKHGADDEQCDCCEMGKLFLYEHVCKQEHLYRIGKDAFLSKEEAEEVMGVNFD